MCVCVCVCVCVCIYNMYICINNFANRFLYTIIRMLSSHHIHHVPKRTTYHKAIVVITKTTHCFHDHISVTPILEHSVVDHL